MSAEPPRAAVALAYAEGDAAPRVIAKGRGLVADEIVRRAREAGVVVKAAPQLCTLLMQVEIDRAIPPSLYVAVAELLAWVWRIEREGAAAPRGEAR